MAPRTTPDLKPTPSPMAWQWMPRVRRDADGCLRVAFPPPRGPLSFVALAVSGLVLAISGLGTVMVRAANLPLPAALAATLWISAVSFAAFAMERRLAKRRSGLSIRLVPVDQGSPAHYEVYRGTSLVEREVLLPDKLVLATAPPSGPLVLVLFPHQADEPYRAEIAGKSGYILLHGDLRFPDQLYERIRQICRALGVDMVHSVTVEANLLDD